MKRFDLIIAAVVLALLTVAVLARAAWPASAEAATSPDAAATAVAPGDVRVGSAGWHYLHSHPTHWRACLLQQ
jgi:hypothetical protein